jgi:hypothetical protein
MTDSIVVAKQTRNLSRFAAGSAFAASTLFIILLVALHFLKPDLDPSWRFISEYELGDYGWLMRLAFLSLAVSCAGLGVAIVPQIRTIVGYLGLVLLLLSAGGMTLAAIFAPDRDNKTHEVGAMLDNVPFAALMINWSLSRHAQWFSARRTLLYTAGLPLLGLIVFVVSMVVMLPRNGGQPGPAVLVGWPNRIMILAHCAWIKAMRISRQQNPTVEKLRDSSESVT